MWNPAFAEVLFPGLFDFAFVACHAWMKVLLSQGSRKASVSVVYFLNPSFFVIFDVRSKMESL